MDTAGTPEDGTRRAYADAPGPAGEPGREGADAPGEADSYRPGWGYRPAFGDQEDGGSGAPPAAAAEAGPAGSATATSSAPWPPVVGPTPALRGLPGGPGIEPPSDEPAASLPAARRVRTGSTWQQAQSIWRDCGVAWQRPAADAQSAEVEWERIQTALQPLAEGGGDVRARRGPGPPPDTGPRRRRGVARTVVIAAAAITAAAVLAAVGFVIAGNGRGPGNGPAAGKLPLSPYPPARLAGADFTAAPSLAARGVFQSLTAVGSYGGTVVAAGAETGTRIPRTQFFVSTDGGRAWRLAPVTGLDGGEPAVAAAPVTVVGGPAGWLALGPGMSWTSRTGRSWRLSVIPDIAPAGSGDLVLTAAATASGFLAAGAAVPGGNQAHAAPVVWSSPDGLNWQRAGAGQLGLSVQGGVVHQIVHAAAHGDSVVIAAVVTRIVRTGTGRTRRTRHLAEIDLWHSADGGRTWAQAPVPVTAGAANAVSGLAPFGGGFVVVRPGTDKVAGSDGVVYTSATGGTWSYAGKITGARTPGLLVITVGGSDQGAAVGTSVPGGNLVAYQSTDGRSWRQSGLPGAAGSPPAGLTLSGLTVAAGGDVVATGTASTADSGQGFLAVSGRGRTPVDSAPVDLARIPGDTYPRLAVSAIAAGPGLDVAVGSANGYPAIWAAPRGGTWSPAAGATPAVFGRPGVAGLSSVTVGGSGWLAVGGPVAGLPHPIVVFSPDGRTWRAGDAANVFAVPGAATHAATSGRAGYVIVGERPSHGRTIGAAWWSAALRSWNVAADARTGALEGSVAAGKGGPVRMLAVAAGPFGYAAVGQDGRSPAVWMSPDGHAWRLTDLPAPGGTGSVGASAVLRYVTARGNRIVAAGTVRSASGTAALIASSADGGNTWAQTRVPLPGGYGALTGLTSGASGFAAVAAAGTPGRLDVVVLRSADGARWQRIAPSGTGLSGPGVQEITALTTAGGKLLGAGFTATQATEGPTLWIAPATPAATRATASPLAR